MDLIAERGIAAQYSGKGVASLMAGHLAFCARGSKGKSKYLNNADIALRVGWLNAIKEWQEEFVGNMSSREFVDIVRHDLLGNRVFVFTPKGEIKNLPEGSTAMDYAYLIHSDIGNKMVAAKVNGILVSPMHVLANAEVVEIITCNALPSKTAFERHWQWLQHAKTRGARHKIMKNFAADHEKEEHYDHKFSFQNDQKSIWEKLLASIDERPSIKKVGNDLVHVNRTLGIPKINGKRNKDLETIGIKINDNSMISGDGLKEVMANKDVMPDLECWKASKIALWHNLEGHSIQWLCVVCTDRRGMLAEVATALTAAGITICSCVAEVDRRKNMGVLLFHIESTYENLVNASSSFNGILGVLSWTAGCSWSNSTGDHFFEC
ncbi:hypothetical protein HPP92_001317 [Vanilla planifolia]|uniref:Putative GTP diphosphokinase RSH1, chloroplastic n=1 Tax=Vanilla planifolia TaxID=51239 RepID=A0A835RQV3_VANPL|nr:hypothetical protein HPP92_001317 [Vanilla planifolia]